MAGRGVGVGPGNRHHGAIYRAGYGPIVRFEARENLSQQQWAARWKHGKPNFVHLGRHPDGAALNAPQDGTALRIGGEPRARAVLAMLAVMRDPGFAQHPAAKTTSPARNLAIPGPLLIRRAGL